MLDGELVALDVDGKPDFPQLCECVLLRRTQTPPFVSIDLKRIAPWVRN